MILEAILVANIMCDRKYKVVDEKGSELAVVNEHQAKDFLTSLGLGYQTNILALLSKGETYNVLLGQEAIPLQTGEKLRAVSFIAEEC